MPEYIWTLVAILLVEVALFILQSMVINAAIDKREERMFIARHVTSLLQTMNDIEYYDQQHKKRKTTSEKDEDLNGPDDPDIDDFLD